MQFWESEISGVFEISATPHKDERGSFARVYCPEEFEQAGIKFKSTQINLSTNPAKHTLRGLHFQLPPYSEAKLVRCTSGSIFDVVVDIRAGSNTFGQWQSFELSTQKLNAVFIPKGCAHGFLTLKDNTSVQYQMGTPYQPNQAKGIIWNDAALAIKWPARPRLLSSADENLPGFHQLEL